MKNFKEPYFVVDFNMSICNFEILINDVSVFKKMNGGSIASHYPINHFILESGTQQISIKVFPLLGETALRKNSFLKVKVHAFDSSTQDYTNLHEVFKYETPKYEGEEPPAIVKIAKFDVSIPYSINGWKSSLEITKNMQQEVLSFYKKIHLLATTNTNELFNLFNSKFLEVDKALYLNDNNKNEWNDLLNKLNRGSFVLQPFPSKPIVKIQAHKKMAEVLSLDGTSVLNYINPERDEFNLPIFIHKKDNVSGFEIIR